MTSKLYTAILVLLLGDCCLAQQPVLQWAKAFQADNIYNYDAYNNGRSVGVDQEGNVYSAGLFMYNVDFDPGPGLDTISGAGPYHEGIYISKLSPNGDFIWTKQLPLVIEFSAIELKVDKDGNVFLTSYIGDTADMDPGPDTLTRTPTGSRDAFVVKLDTNGNLVWEKQFGGPGDTVPAGSALDIDKDGNVIVCGIFNGTVDFDPGPGSFMMTTNVYAGFITKLNSNGDFLWAKKLESHTSIYYSVGIDDIKCDRFGNVYTTGTFTGAIDFDPGTADYILSSGGPTDGFVSKLDANGNFVWAKQVGYSAMNEVVIPTGIDFDSHNNVYTLGSFEGTQDFDPGPGVYNLTSAGLSPYILKLDENGDFIWVKKTGENGAGEDLVIDNADNVYAIGFYDGSIDFDPGPGEFLITNLYDETVLTKYDNNGNFIYAAPFRGSGNYGRRMVTDPLHSIYITGFFYGTVDFNPGAGVYDVDAGASEAPFVVKLGKCANATTSVLNINTCNSYTLNNVIFDSSGTYTQVIPNLSGCDSVITLHLTINKKFSAQTKTICAGETYYAGGANQAAAGTYTDTLQTALGCDSIITTTLIINPKPVPDLGPDRNICSNTVVTLNPGVFATYYWQNMQTQNILTTGSVGLYWVTVTNNYNCVATDTVKINSIIPSPDNFLNETDSMCSYETLTLEPFNTYNDYLWSTGDRQRDITIQTAGRYWLKVTDINGCYGVDTIAVIEKQCMSGAYIPTAFTPNHDGKNDVFKPLLFGNVLHYNFSIYNRFGQVVFHSTTPGKGWDGSVAGIPQNQNTFIWVCSYQLDGEPAKTEKGTVVLMK